ncbi:hypothetical protein P5673_000939 [Acropora cervicornis]|uniref:Uncharacterized protein n=1 Tax=Acropora cervicornis TaxID=6130 RepID=A0AAD9R539_ACRCE|nr:hypothetical protein P5673_000939 [Acropora cervicornis]
MRFYYSALFVLSSLLLRSCKGLSESKPGEGSATVSTIEGELGPARMLALIVLGIFGGILVVLICFASWSMILTCCELRSKKTRNRDSFLEEKQQDVKSILTPTISRHPLEKQPHVDSIESIV